LKSIEQIVAEQRAIVELSETEDRNLTDDEVARYEKLEGKLKLAQKTDEIVKRQKAYEAPSASLAAVVNVAAPKADDTEARAFDAYLRTGQENQDLTELRSQVVGTNSAGGYTVPTEWLPKITERLKAFGGLANQAEIINTANGDPLRWPYNDDTGNTGGIAAEAGNSGSGADMVFGINTLGAYSYDALGASGNPLTVSRELLADSAYDIESFVIRKLTQRIARKQAADYVNGTGGGTAPTGISTSTNTHTFSTTSGTQAIAYADLVAAVHAVDPAYRDGAVWTFNDYTMAQIETLVDGQGRPLLNMMTDGINVGRSNQMLLGYPVQIDQAWANWSDPSTHKFGAFGNVNEGFVIRQVQDISLFVDPYSNSANRLVAYNMWSRTDSAIQDANAFVILSNVTP
jgi:HK97 family phage major capsid protein